MSESLETPEQFSDRLSDHFNLTLSSSSPPQVLVLLDVTPDQSMVDEGVAREVINHIQKLRKKVG